MTLWAVVPAKALATAKSRLAPLLSPDQRQALAAALLLDVLVALRSTTDVARVLVVSADPAARDLADSLGAAALPEPASAPALPGTEDAATPGDDGEVTLNAALDHAGAVAAAAGATALLVLPADLPLLTPADVSALTAALPPAPSIVLAPTRDGGTSALLRQPPLALPARFGAGSLRAHLRAAAAANVRARLVWRPNLALDIDRPEDLLRLASQPPRSRAQALLAEWDLAAHARGESAAI